MSNSKPLNTLRPGESAVIAEIAGDDSLAMRLMEMGVLEGESISMIGTAPFGDPLEFEIRGYRLSLRKAEAERVLLQQNNT
ncbi:MAG TPA: ferrous iron transport protein A [Planctomycetaceae bacterium]|nr:ferrous iron transport protein A [Planctomycetaceae bacterium]